MAINQATRRGLEAWAFRIDAVIEDGLMLSVAFPCPLSDEWIDETEANEYEAAAWRQASRLLTQSGYGISETHPFRTTNERAAVVFRLRNERG